MTGRNKLIGGALTLVVLAQFCHGTYAIVWTSLRTRKSHNYFTVPARAHLFLVKKLPIMDVFGICGYERWITGGPIYFSLTISFGTSSPSTLQRCFTRKF